MNSKNKISFFVNIFPSTSYDWENLKCDNDCKVLYVRHLFDCHSALNVEPEPKYWCFKTDQVFINRCQSEIYTTVINEIIEKTFVGVDSVILGYGQNYSGKTFTITGLQNQFDLRGIVPRFIFDLMTQKKSKEEDISIEVRFSAVDIFGASLFDLLQTPTKKCKDEKEVRKIKIKSEIHCLELLFKAEAARMTVKEKSYNAHSATNIITFSVLAIPLNNQDTLNKIGKIHFIDLAGVETIGRNPVTSLKDKNTQGIANVTKTMLEIFALQYLSKRSYTNKSVSLNKNGTHTVTKYLGKSLSPASNLKLICHIRPNREDIAITLSLLRFGMTFLDITMFKLQPNVEINEGKVLKQLKETVQAFNDEILAKQMCGNAFPIEISQDRVEFVKRFVLLYLNNEISEQELLSVIDDCSLLMKLIKAVSKENVLLDNLSIGLQTDGQSLLSAEEKNTNTFDVGGKKMTLIKSESKQLPTSFTEEKQENAALKGKPGKSETKSKMLEKTGKNKDKLKKGDDKPVLIEAEVQVNLIEPKPKLPNLDSREGLWALFMISNPEVQSLVDKLNLLISRKKNIYYEEQTKYEKVNRSINKTQLKLNKLASFRHTVSAESYDHEGHIIMLAEESELARQLLDLKEKSLTTHQKLIDAQTQWLDSLEKTNCEKQLIEIQFQDFCIQNNLLAINAEKAAQKSSSEELFSKPNGSFKALTINTAESVALSHKIPSTDDLKNQYVALQTKYLKQI